MYSKTLNKSFWDNFKFDPIIRKKILKIVQNLLQEIELESEIEDIRLTGSLANFNYNKYSDLDVHIIINFSDINNDKKLVKDALDGKRFIWNLRHDIYLKGHEVELYFEDTNEPHYSTGVFSLLEDEWVVKPEYNPPKFIDKNLLKLKLFYIDDLINRMLKELDSTNEKSQIKLIYKKANTLKDKIMKVRGDALKSKGEFAFENLLFKKLRNLDSIEKLINLINASYDKFFMESLSYNKTVDYLLN